MVFAARIFQSRDFISSAKDEKGVRYGNKTATLEPLDFMLPILLEPGLVAGRHVVACVDNVAYIFGFENGQMKNDESASILIRAD
jgi:hypothetical protein